MSTPAQETPTATTKAPDCGGSRASSGSASDAVCMGCHRPLVICGTIAFWNPKTRELVCDECRSNYTVIFLRACGEQPNAERSDRP